MVNCLSGKIRHWGVNLLPGECTVKSGTESRRKCVRRRVVEVESARVKWGLRE